MTDKQCNMLTSGLLFDCIRFGLAAGCIILAVIAFLTSMNGWFLWLIAGLLALPGDRS